MASSKSKQKEQLWDDASDVESGRQWRRSDVGLVLLDSFLKPIAFNPEAVAILTDPNVPPAEQANMPCVPEEVIDAVRNRSSSQAFISDTYFKAGKRKYVCQAFSLTCNETFPYAVVALLLHRNSSAAEAIDEVAADFRLTEREKQALSGVCLGLSSKELAKRMSISPNTVKAFLRIIMVKMGVTTRAAVVAKILERNANAGGRTTPPVAGTMQRAATSGA